MVHCPPWKGKHFASVTEPEQVGEVLRALEGYAGTLPVRCALRLAPLVFVRPGELRHAQWKDIDLDNAEWRYLVTKTETPHIVPLSRQAIEIFAGSKTPHRKRQVCIPQRQGVPRVIDP